MVFQVEIWLHAITEDVPSKELSAYYKANECPTLDAVLERSEAVRLGITEVSVPEKRGTAAGPVGRVDDLLSLRGTSTWPPMELPLLDNDLSRHLIASFEARPEDPSFEVLPVPQLAEFLAAHLGFASILLSIDSIAPTTCSPRPLNNGRALQVRRPFIGTSVPGVIDISYIEDEVEQEQPEHAEPVGTPPSRPRWQRWLAFTVIGALLLGMFAVAFVAHGQRKSLRSADTVSVGEVYTVRVFSGQRWMRVNQITLLAGTADGDAPRSSSSRAEAGCHAADRVDYGGGV